MKNADTDRIFRKFDRAIVGEGLADNGSERGASGDSPWMSVRSGVDDVRALLERETALVLQGDMAGVMRLQGEKAALTTKLRQALNGFTVSDKKTDDAEFSELRRRISLLNAAVEKSLRTISAAKEATVILRNNALRRIEEGVTDGLYAATGEIARQKEISVNGVRIKV